MFDKLTGIIPTDNLYKFMALSGSILCAACILFPMWRVTNLLRSTQDLVSQKNLLTAETQYFTIRLSRSTEADKTYINGKNERSKKRIYYLNDLTTDDLATYFRDKNTRESYEFIYKYGKKFRRIEESDMMNMDDILKENHQINMKKVEIDNLDQRIKVEKKILEMVNDISLFGRIFFGLIALIGFFFWYKNNQYIQDKILQKQLNS